MKNNAKRLLVLALVLIFVGYLGAYFIQTDGGKVEVTELKYEVASGQTQSAMIFKPENATLENPAPAIIVMHGWYNNKEMQDMNYVEYARRGYVVVSVDQNAHGDSDRYGVGYEYTGGAGMHECVQMVADIPYVDSSKIGVSGHSFGAEACMYAMYLDEANLISSALMVSADTQYTANYGLELWPRVISLTDDAQGGYMNAWGSKDIAIVACQYDEFYHGTRTGNEGDIGPGVGYTAPRDFIGTDAAQSFLHFGVDPTGLEVRESGVLYTENVDGVDAVRAIYTPAITHPEATHNTGVAEFSIRYFEETLGAPNPIDSTNQVWQWKAVFNSLSLHAMILFLACFAICLLDTPYFASLKAEKEVVALPAPKGKSAAWFWGGILVTAIFACFSFPYMFDPLEATYPNLYNYVYDGNAPFLKQWPVTFMGCWSAACGVVLLVVLVLSYILNGKKTGFSLAERGVTISWGKLWKTIVLAVVTASAAVSLVFLGDWLWEVDARIWVIALRAFDSDKLIEMVKYLPFFLVYYVVMSVSVNSFNFVKNGKPWVNVLIMVLAVVAGPAAFYILQYGSFHATGYLWTELQGLGAGSVISGIWVYPVLFWLPCAVLVSRAIYKKTNNPYIGGIIMAIMVTVASCANTITFY